MSTVEGDLFCFSSNTGTDYYKIIAWWDYTDSRKKTEKKVCKKFFSFKDEAHLNRIIKEAESSIVVNLKEGKTLVQIIDMYEETLDNISRMTTDDYNQTFFALIVCLKKLKFSWENCDDNYGWRRITKKNVGIEYEYENGKTGLVCVDEKNLVFDAITNAWIGCFDPHTEVFSFDISPTKCNWCANCQNTVSKRKCACCRTTYYCSDECQKTDWKTHKKICKEIRK